MSFVRSPRFWCHIEFFQFSYELDFKLLQEGSMGDYNKDYRRGY